MKKLGVSLIGYFALLALVSVNASAFGQTPAPAGHATADNGSSGHKRNAAQWNDAKQRSAAKRWDADWRRGASGKRSMARKRSSAKRRDLRLRGGRGPDVLRGRRGNDQLRGGSGNDRLYGAAGRDLLFGGNGRDRLFGGKGRDRLFGGRGNDRLAGGSGSDFLRGASGRDTLLGGLGSDRIYGGRGRDRLKGGAGRDRLYGGAGRDVIQGGPGGDRILARGGGRDRVDCGSGRDVVFADEGDRLRGCERVVRRGKSSGPRDGGSRVPSGGSNSASAGPGSGAPPDSSSGRGNGSGPRDKRPNIVLILTDDQRYDTVDRRYDPDTGLPVPDGSTAGVPYMPNVTSLLADQGLRFKNAFVTRSLCCPSRSSILTGQYSHNTGVFTNNPPNGGFPAFSDSSTLATWLSAAGYRTALLGKYLNLYGDAQLNPAFTPPDPTEDPNFWSRYVPPGWDTFRAFAGGTDSVLGDLPGAGYYDYYLNIDGQPALEPHGSGPGDYSADVLAGHALDFLRRADAEDDDQPFFLELTPNAPHAPFTPGPDDVDAFAGIAPLTVAGPPSFNESDVSDKPTWLRDGVPAATSDQVQLVEDRRLNQLRSMLAVDRAVASVVNELNRLGELDNTLVIYTSDNGYHWGEHRVKRGKWTAYEESIRVPLIMRGPGVRRGETGLIAANIDLAPTFAELAGVMPGLTVDGRSLVPLFEGDPTAWRNDLLIEHWLDSTVTGLPSRLPTFKALYTDGVLGHYKYVQYEDETGSPTERELYDLNNDPNEEESLLRQDNPPTSGLQPLVDALSTRLAELGGCSGLGCR